MRLFVALEIPAAVRENLAAFLSELRALSSEAGGKGPRWVKPENLHVTLKFIGEVAPTKLGEIQTVLANLGTADGAVDLSCHGLGFFPNERHPQVFWVGLQASANLAELAGRVDRALEPVGIAREKRAFSPHLTLARIESPRLPEKLRATMQSAASRQFGLFRAREFHLIESKTKPAGAEYTRVASFALAAEA